MRHAIQLLAAGAMVLSTVAACTPPSTSGQLLKLLADDGAERDFFGASVAIGGTTAIVGAPQGENENGLFSGSAYIFDITRR